ncbi:MAG: hypothetical protein O4808_02290 [Trichodesmium sp. St17_bin3_1_1]|jgi:hypothetical protein|nr:hypothetical protein [Trichodesmium sp. St17_bin3_1_1]
MKDKITVDFLGNDNVWSDAEKVISHSRIWQFLLKRYNLFISLINY